MGRKRQAGKVARLQLNMEGGLKNSKILYLRNDFYFFNLLLYLKLFNIINM